jgi:hypothetical protein
MRAKRSPSAGLSRSEIAIDPIDPINPLRAGVRRGKA